MKLVNRSGTEGIRSHQQGNPPSLHQPLRELRNAGGFPDTVHADDENDKGFRTFGQQLFERWPGRRPQHIEQRALQGFLYVSSF